MDETKLFQALVELVELRSDIDYDVSKGNLDYAKTKYRLLMDAISGNPALKEFMRGHSDVFQTLVRFLTLQHELGSAKEERSQLLETIAELEGKLKAGGEGDERNWLAAIDPKTIIAAMDGHVPVIPEHEEPAEFLARLYKIQPLANEPHLSSEKQVSMWKAIEIEFNILVCTDDPKYKEVRQDVRKAAKWLTSGEGQAILGILSHGIVSRIPGAGSWLPYVPGSAALLLNALKFGQEVYCRTQGYR